MSHHLTDTLKKIFPVLFFLIAIESSANTYYVATNGNNANPGTISAPFATWERLSSVLVAGDIAYIRGGTYRSGKSASTSVQCLFTNLNGTATDSIKIFAYPGETPVLNLDDVLHTGSDVYGFYLSYSNYVWIKGLRITGLAQNPSGNVLYGFILERSNNCRIELCEVDNIGGQGFFSFNANDILYKNCDVHHCDDRYSTYAWNGSNGFSATGGGNTSTRNTYDGCRAWWISDDGWDFFASDGLFTIKNCWSFWNGNIPGTFNPAGDGVGFKLGPTGTNKSTTLLRILTNNLAVQNRAFGFDQNGGNCIYNLYNNTSFNNGDIGFVWGYYPSIPQVIKNNISHNDPSPIQGTEITGDHNSWNGGVTLTNSDFQSITPTGLDGPRQSDGSLPDISFLHLNPSSDLIDNGINVGLPYSGIAPDISSFELGNSTQNQVPTANAGLDQVITLPLNIFTLSGSGTDPDGTISSYQWTKVSGPLSVTITLPTQPTTTVITLLPGVYQFELRVTDNSGAFGRDTVTVTVNAAANQMPIANAGPNQNITLPTNSLTLTGSGTDPDGTITAYQWTKIAGPTSFTIVSPTQASTAINSLVQGVYQFVLRVTDNSGAFGRDTVVVTVNAAIPNQAPTANAGLNQNITLPTNSLTLIGSGSDPDGTITSYQWTKIAGPTCTIASPAQASTVINSLVQGVYQFELRVTDNSGAFGRDTVTVTVNAAANQAPTANAGLNQNITLPTNSLTLIGSGSDPDGTITSYQWTKIAGPTCTIASPAQASTVINSLIQGVYQFELRVTDNSGAFGRDTVVVTVNAAIPNQAPIANAGLNQNITLPTNSLTLNGSGSDPDGTIAAYQWTKIAGPGSFTIVSPTQASTAINSLVQGVYQFELRVTDNSGAFGRDTVVVTVNAAIPNQAPTANAGLNQNITLPTNSLTLTGSGNDPDGTITAYQWTKIAGPTSSTIVSPTQASTVVNTLVQGVYQFELRVTDNSGAFGRDTVTVTVNAAANQAPTANAGSDKTITLPNNSLTLNGSGSDPDGTIVSYQWTKIAGPGSFTIASPTQASTIMNTLIEGVYQFQLEVTDNSGATAIDVIVVTVNAAHTNNGKPTSKAGTKKTVNLPTSSVMLEGSGTDPDGTITEYSWKVLTSPAPCRFSNSRAAITEVLDLTKGIYQFELKVTDNSGETALDTVEVEVKELLTPTVSIYPNPVSDILNLKLDALTISSPSTILIYDMSGKILYQESFIRNQSSILKQIDVSRFRSGIYIVKVTSDINNTLSIKMVKQ